MPSPLTAKNSGGLSPGELVAGLVILGIPAAGLWHCFNRQVPLHFENPWLNLAAHAGLVLFPLSWVLLLNYRPVIYESSDADTILDRSTYFSCLSFNWWMMFMMLATPFFAVIAVAQEVAQRYLPHPELLSTSPWRAVLIMVVVFCLGALYATLLLGWSEPATRVSSEGLRTGVLRFYEWKDIHHLSQRGNVYAIYHQVNPALPAVAFRVRSRESRSVLDRFLSENHVRIYHESTPAYLIVRFAVFLGFAANVTLGFWLRSQTTLSLVSVVLILFGVGIVLTIVLERYRGVSKYGKYRPVLQFFDEDTTGKSIEPPN